jgi:hypothetical protein
MDVTTNKPMPWLFHAYNQGMDIPPQELDLNFLVPNVVTDGQLYAFSSDNNRAPATISFLQMRPSRDDKSRADVVASISFPNLDAMKQFVKDAQNRIEQHEKREK